MKPKRRPGSIVLDPVPGQLEVNKTNLSFSIASASVVRLANSQLLPTAIAVLISGVLVAGIPLAIMRRRSVAGEEEDAVEP